MAAKGFSLIPANLSDANGWRSLRYHRTLLLAGSATYLLWWAAVELLLPGSYNPLPSRLAVCLLWLGFFGASFVFAEIADHLDVCIAFGIWVLTLHYFYLFYRNGAGVDWVVGCYITVIAASASFHRTRALFWYSCFVFALSVALIFADRSLMATIFLPGVVTILAFTYLSLRQRSETSQWLLSLFDAIFEGIVLHRDGIIVDSNEALASLLGYRKQELLGMEIAEIIAPESRDLTSEKIASMAEEPYETVCQRKDGTLVPVEVRAKHHVVRGRKYRLAALADLTARKERERQRVLYEASEASVRIRDEFLSIASHELKTPITNIKLQAQLTRKKLENADSAVLQPDHVKKFVDRMNHQADRLTRLVEEMLDVSRVSEGKMDLDPQEFDLAELAREAIASFAAATRPNRPIEIEASGPIPVFADRLRIEQVVVNLLSNAIKYGEGKPIRVRVYASSTDTSLEVIDRGIGIAPEDQTRIFRRFERIGSDRKISGLGLGLFICKHIIDLHHGWIEIESRLGQGARFRVILPRNGLSPENGKAASPN